MCILCARIVIVTPLRATPFRWMEIRTSSNLSVICWPSTKPLKKNERESLGNDAHGYFSNLQLQYIFLLWLFAHVIVCKWFNQLTIKEHELWKLEFILKSREISSYKIKAFMLSTHQNMFQIICTKSWYFNRLIFYVIQSFPIKNIFYMESFKTRWKCLR